MRATDIQGTAIFQEKSNPSFLLARDGHGTEQDGAETEWEGRSAEASDERQPRLASAACEWGDDKKLSGNATLPNLRGSDDSHQR